jgi:translocation and assembly module TamB
MHDGVITFSDSLFRSEESEMHLTGDIDLREKDIALDIGINSSDVKDFSSPFYENLSAPLVFRGSIRGPLNDPVISGEATFGPGHINGNPVDKAWAEFSYGAGLLELRYLKAQKDVSFCEISGSIRFRKASGLFDFADPYYNARGSCEALPLSPLLASLYRDMSLKGIVSGSFELEGDAADFQAPATINFIDMNIYGHPVEQLSVRMEVMPDRVQIIEAEASQGDSVARAEGIFYFDGNIEGLLEARSLNIKELFRTGNFPVEGTTALRIKWSGTLDSPVAEFEADILDLSVRGRNTGGGSVSGVFRNARLVAEGSVAGERIGLRLMADLPSLHDWSVDIKLRDGRYDFLAAVFFENLPDDFSLRSEGEMVFRSTGGRLTMHAGFDRLNLGMYDYTIKNSGDIELEAIDDRLFLKSVSFIGNRAELFLSGSVRPGKEFDLSLDGDINIMPLKIISRELTSLEGRAVVSLHIKGEWSAPDMFGAVTFSDVYASMSTARQRIGPVDGTFFLKKDRVSFDSVTAGVAGGKVVLNGEGRFVGLKPERMYVNMKLDGVRMRPVEGFRATLDGSLFYELSSKGGSLSGDLEISRARYMKEVDWKKWLVGLKEMNHKKNGYPVFFRDTELNIRLSGRDDVVISNNLLDAPVKLDINILGKPESVGIIGRVGANSGSLYFRGHEFRVLGGTSIDFIDPAAIKPLFHIVSETYRSDYHIRLSLDGTMDEFSLSLFSDPPLSEQEILTLLTFGGLAGGSRGFDSGIATEEATSILTGGLQSNIEGELKSITGFERISIEPHTTSTGAFTSRITVARRLLEDKIKVIYSTTIGSSEEQLIKVEYKLSDEWSLVGSRDELDSTGGDIKFRFEFR